MITEINKIIKPPDQKIIWQAQEGAQQRFITCPIRETLIEGNRGGGKTDVLLMKYASNVGRGFKESWKGIIFRTAYKDLADIISKSKRWFKQIFPTATYNKTEKCWTFQDGEKLYFAFARTLDDYWNYHGHSYPFVGWEELTNWAILDLYLSMMSTNRTDHKEIDLMYKSTCNPFGPGHNAVKKRFIDMALPEQIITEIVENELTNEKTEMDRCYIHSESTENKVFHNANPNYLATLLLDDNPDRKNAWAYGSWDITSGGMFDDIWDRKIHMIKPFIPPRDWYFDRSFDWGSSKPFSVGWWAMSTGSPAIIDGRERNFPKHTLFRIAEYYGCEKGKENVGLKLTAQEVGEKIKAYEIIIKELYGISRINAGPADSSIFDTDHNNQSIAEMINLGYGTRNDIFVKSNKGPGTRKKRWELIRTRLKESKNFPMENPGIFVYNTCKSFVRTVPVLPRDEKDSDDIDTNAEDHIADETGYRVLHKPDIVEVTRFIL